MRDETSDWVSPEPDGTKFRLRLDQVFTTLSLD
jgi:hypothetical protein